MIKKFFKLFIIFFAFIIVAYSSKGILQSILLNFNHTIQSSYHATIDFISDTIQEHINQQKEIKKLKKQLIDYDKNLLITQRLANELQDLYKLSHSSMKSYTNIALAKTLSYSNSLDFNKIWLEMDEYNSSKMYGLIYKESVAGIVVNKENKPLALLNSDPKCSISIYVLDGKKKAPGIVHGNSDNTLIADYIPTWIPIHVGDKVITSGLDNIFFIGLKVGVVTEVQLSQGYQQAIIDPYYKTNKPNYFYVIKELE